MEATDITDRGLSVADLILSALKILQTNSLFFLFFKSSCLQKNTFICLFSVQANGRIWIRLCIWIQVIKPDRSYRFITYSNLLKSRNNNTVPVVCYQNIVEIRIVISSPLSMFRTGLETQHHGLCHAVSHTGTRVLAVNFSQLFISILHH